MSYFGGIPTELIIEICYYLPISNIVNLNYIVNNLLDNKLLWINILNKKNMRHFVPYLDNDNYDYFESYKLFKIINNNTHIERMIDDCVNIVNKIPDLSHVTKCYNLENYIKLSLQEGFAILDPSSCLLYKNLTKNGNIILNLITFKRSVIVKFMYHIMDYMSKGIPLEKSIKILIIELKNAIN